MLTNESHTFTCAHAAIRATGYAWSFNINRELWSHGFEASATYEKYVVALQTHGSWELITGTTLAQAVFLALAYIQSHREECGLAPRPVLLLAAPAPVSTLHEARATLAVA